MAGLINDILNPLIGPDDVQFGGATNPFSGWSNQAGLMGAFGNPVFTQALYLLSQSGQNPFEVLGSFMQKGGKAVKKAKGDPSKLIFGAGKNAMVFDMGGLSQKIPEYAKAAQAAQVKAQGETWDLFKSQPQFAGIFGEAAGTFSDKFTSDLNNAYEGLAGSALGQGAQSGFLSDPTKQANILGPLALQKTEYLKNLQKAAEAQALGLTGAGGLANSTTAFNTGAGGAMGLVSPFMQAQSLLMGGTQFNASGGFNASMQNSANSNGLMNLLASLSGSSYSSSASDGTSASGSGAGLLAFLGGGG